MNPMEKKKIGWGIVGPSRIAEQYAEGVLETNEGYIAAVGSRTLEHSQKFASKYGGKPYDDYHAMMSDPDVDIVYIAVPHPIHEQYVLMAAQAGKAIMCEKPFAANLKQAKNMIAAAEKYDVFCMEGLWSRFFPAWEYVRALLDSGELGDITSLEAYTAWGGDRHIDRELISRHNCGSTRLIDPNLAGGSLLDAGVYSIASLSVAMGDKFVMPEKLYSTMRFNEYGVDSDCDMLMQFKDGMTAHIGSSLCRRNHETTIYCEKGSIYIPTHRSPEKVVVSKNSVSFRRCAGIMPYRMEIEHKTIEFPFHGYGFQFEAANVHDCLRRGLKECPRVKHSETLLSAEICDTARRQCGYKFPFEE